MKINVGILIFGDPTRRGTINSEVKFLNSLYEYNNEDCDFYIITVNSNFTKKIIENNKTIYNFKHDIIEVFSEKDLYKINNISCIITYPNHSSFYGGVLNDNNVLMYKIVSYLNNELNRKTFIRVNDSELKIRDYRSICKLRLEHNINNKENNETVFIKDKNNLIKANDLISTKPWNYSKIFWIANGSKENYDWVSETLYDRETKMYRVDSKEQINKNTIYLSDDLLFLVRKNYERFNEKYTDSLNHEKKICYIGFFDTVNKKRAKAFETLFNNNTFEIPIKIFGKGTEIIETLKDKQNIEIIEGFIEGDSEDYFDFLNKHLAYVFIGKGNNKSRYIGKTLYDSVVAKTPVIVYKKCDTEMICFKNKEYYFENEEQLKIIYDKLLDVNIRNNWIKQQREEIFNNLKQCDFKFKDQSISLNETVKEIYIKNDEISKRQLLLF